MSAGGFLDWLYGLQVHGIKLGLTSITELLRRLGDPQDRFKSVHVAGTDGKGSVAACIEAVLRRSGFATGLYTSPHLVDFNERIRVSGRMIDDERLSELAAELMPVVDGMAAEGMRCTFFEATTALAFMHFEREGVEYAVVEVGMGGRFDATNVITPEVCAICNISLEHTEYLGCTLESIAYEKAGVMKPGVPCVTMNSDPVFETLSAVAAEKGAPLTRVLPEDIVLRASRRDGVDFTYRGEDRTVSIPGRHQAANAALAIAALSTLDGFEERIRDNLREGLASTEWACRMQKVGGLPLIIDVTHTRKGSEDLAADIRELYGKVLLVFGALGDKDLEHISENLSGIAERAIVTAPDSDRAASVDRLLPIAEGFFEQVVPAADVAEAMDTAFGMRHEDETILVTGSLHMAGEALVWLRRTYS